MSSSAETKEETRIQALLIKFIGKAGREGISKTYLLSDMRSRSLKLADFDSTLKTLVSQGHVESYPDPDRPEGTKRAVMYRIPQTTATV